MDALYLSLAWSILGFTAFSAWQGALPPFARYFSWAVPAGVIAAATLYRGLASGVARAAVGAGTCLLLVLPVAQLMARALPLVPEPAPLSIVAAAFLPPDVPDASWMRGQVDAYEAIARYLDAQPAGITTLVDASVGGTDLLLFLKSRHAVVTTGDEDFLERLRAPIGRVDQILVPRPTFDALGRSDVLRLHPRLYDGAEPWAVLEHEFPSGRGWRLYRVVQP